MEKIKIVADSTIDLDKELLTGMDIEIIPLIVSYEDEPERIYHDGVDITQDDIKAHVEKTGKLPVTAAVGPAIYTEAFDKLIDEGYGIIFTGIGSKLSSNFQSATLGRNTCKDPSKVTMIDSCNLSFASGLLVYIIRDLINEGKTREEIKEICDTEIAPNIKAQFAIDRCDYMVKGGRCSTMTGIITKVLSIKPILVVEDGKLYVGKKPIGSVKVSVRTMISDMMKDKADIDPRYCFIGGMEINQNTYYAKEELEKTGVIKNIYITHAGCVISSHCGPGTVGIMYLKKAKAKKKKTSKGDK